MYQRAELIVQADIAAYDQAMTLARIAPMLQAKLDEIRRIISRYDEYGSWNGYLQGIREVLDR
jgi:hypothetical protein